MRQGRDGALRGDDGGGAEAEGGGDLREVAAELQLAAARPVEAVEGGLHQGRHDTAQAGLIRTAVGLAVMLHAEPGGGGAERAVLSHTREPTPGKEERAASSSRVCGPTRDVKLINFIMVVSSLMFFFAVSRL